LVNDHDTQRSFRSSSPMRNSIHVYYSSRFLYTSNYRLPYIIYTVYFTLQLCIFLRGGGWGRFRVSGDQYSVQRQHMVNFPTAKRKKGNGFSIYFTTAAGTHPLATRNIISQALYFKYANTRVRLLQFMMLYKSNSYLVIKKWSLL